MNATFLELYSAAELLNPPAIEIPHGQAEISEIVRRRSLFSQRIKQVPATGHPSRLFEDDGSPDRVEHSVPLKAVVARINYNGFDATTDSRSQFAYLQAKDLADTVDGVLRTHDFALWNGNDTSLAAPTTTQYFGAAAQIAAGGNTTTIANNSSIVDGLKSTIAQMVSSSSFGVRPTAIYANPVLLNLIDREMKSKFNVVLVAKEILPGYTVKYLLTQAGELPLIPDWSLPYTGTPGFGSAVLPACIANEDLIEYHWLSDPNPRVFQLDKGKATVQYVVIKFGGLVVKQASSAHRFVLVNR